MIRQPPPLPQQNRPLPCRMRQRPQRERVGVGVRHVCNVHLSPIHAPICPLPLWGREPIGGNWGDRSRIANGKLAFLQLPPFPQQNCPLPLWGRDGVGFSDAASVPFRPSVCQNHHHRYRACFFTHLQGISAMSPVADDKPTPHPAPINPTPALPRGGREPIGGNLGDRSRIPPLSGRFCDCGKMANATPTPALPRCGRWRVLQGRGRIDCGIGNGCLLFRRTAPSLAGRSPQRRRAGVGVAPFIMTT